jgi:methionyl-tRNA formyltransferase
VNVLVLSPYGETISGPLQKAGDEAVVWNDEIDLAFCQEKACDWIVSYGYRHIIRKPVLSAFERRIINLHISFLPWNRGSDPNFWSWVDDTPKGVTIHLMDEGIDTGNIIAQEKTAFGPEETLSSSYDKLRHHLEDLFARTWPRLRTGECAGIPQNEGGKPRKQADKEDLFARLTVGWDSPVSEVCALRGN